MFKETLKNTIIAELKKIIFDKNLKIFYFIAPFIYIIILSSVYLERRVSNLPVGIVDEENTKTRKVKP